MRLQRQLRFLALATGIYLGFIYAFLTDVAETEVNMADPCPPSLPCPFCLCPNCPKCPSMRRNCSTAQRAPSERKRQPCFPHNLVMSTFDLGGLGTKMAEYASLLAITTMSGYYPAVSQALYDELSAAFAHINHLPFNVSVECAKEVRFMNPTANPEVLDTFLDKHKGKHPYIHLINYPNTVRLYHKMYEVLKHQFTFKLDIFEFASQFIDLVALDVAYTISRPIFVSIHVRRLGYDYHLKTTQKGTRVEVEYFARAIAALNRSLNITSKQDKERLIYIVTSDDVRWGKKSLDSFSETFYFPADFYRKMPVVESNHFDMCVISLCNHSIYDYGMFGFWGSYLAGGHTVAAHMIGTKVNDEVENIKAAQLPNWTFIAAHPEVIPKASQLEKRYREV